MSRCQMDKTKDVKYVFDFVGALIGIILTSPLLVILALLIRIKLGSPIIYVQ